MLFIVCAPRAEVKRGLQRVAQALIEPPLGAQQRAGHRGLVDAQLLRDLGHGLILLKIHPEQLPLPRGQRLLPRQAQVALEPKQLTVVVLRVGAQPRAAMSP